MTIPPIGASLPTIQAPGLDTKDPTTRAALSFERQLIAQLTKQLADSAKPADDEASAATSTYRDMLPNTLADAVISAGGLGLAKQLVEGQKA
jgi:Rod binding domain-containing protein